VLYDPKTHIMRTDNMNTTILELQPKRRQTRRQSNIRSWLRIRISTDNFIELMGLRYKTEGENRLNLWVPATLFPENTASVKAKGKRTVKRQAARLKVPEPGQSVQLTESPVIDLPLFLPIPLPPRKPAELSQHSSILDRLDFGGFGSSPYSASSLGHPSPSAPDIDLTVAENTTCKSPSASRYHNVAPPIIDLTTEDSSAQAESSAMGAHRHSKHKDGKCKSIDTDNDDIIYISD
jgi:hypothetical protein